MCAEANLCCRSSLDLGRLALGVGAVDHAFEYFQAATKTAWVSKGFGLLLHLPYGRPGLKFSRSVLKVMVVFAYTHIYMSTYACLYSDRDCKVDHWTNRTTKRFAPHFDCTLEANDADVAPGHLFPAMCPEFCMSCQDEKAVQLVAMTSLLACRWPSSCPA